MTNFNIIPNNDDWGKIDLDDYYPDNYHENFLHKSYVDLMSDINKPSGIGIISSISWIPIKPFIFYSLCILKGIESQQLSLINHLSEFRFDEIIWAIEAKFDEEPSHYFIDLVNPIKIIIGKIRRNEINTTYSKEEEYEIINEAEDFIDKILNFTK